MAEIVSGPRSRDNYCSVPGLRRGIRVTHRPPTGRGIKSHVQHVADSRGVSHLLPDETRSTGQPES
jgi:hypothetical protein